MDEIFLQNNERVYTDNMILVGHIRTCDPLVPSELLIKGYKLVIISWQYYLRYLSVH
jgi:hypothetical protein